jgi:hypothetical protein
MARRTAAAAVLTATLSTPLLLPASAPAGEVTALLKGKVARGMAKIVSPSPGAVAKGGSVNVRVRVGARARSVRAWLDKKEVTRSLRRVGNDRTVRLRAPVLRTGVNHLYARTRDGRGRRDFDVVRFIRARRVKGLLGVRLQARRVRTGRVRARLVLGRGAKLRGWLNGRRLRPAALGSRRRRMVVLDGDEGLRFGRNRLRLLGFSEKGRFDLERRNVVVRRTRPIPAAGRNRRARLRHAVTLDARRSRAAHAGRPLAYSWRIVRAPKGSKARIRGAHGARPRLRPDRVGTYRVRLVVREVSAGRSGASAAAGRRSTATLTVAAVPDISAGGVPIDTIGGAGVTLGAPLNKTYSASESAVIQLVVLDRQDLSLVANNSYGGDEAGTGQLLSDLRTYDDSRLAIIATPPQSFPYIAGLDNLNAALEFIGGQALEQGPQFGLSAIGVPGLGAGNGGTQNSDLGDQRNFNPPPGNLNGFLRPDSSKNFAYVDADYVPFTTAAPGTTATQAVISVGGNSYSSYNMSPGQAGFFVLLLDAGTLEREFAQTFVVSGPGIDSSNLPTILGEMDQLLQDHMSDPTTLYFIQSVGTIERDTADSVAASEWNQVRDDQTFLGGHGYYLNAADGGGYTFVGPANAPTFLSPWGMTASAAATGTAGQLSGMLARNPQSQFYPKIAGTESAIDIGLPEVAFADPVPWPQRDSAHQPALACVGSALDLTLPIEDHYTNTDIDWDGKNSRLQAMTVGDCPPGLPAQSLEDVKKQLGAEWNYVPTIQKNLIPNLQSPLMGGWPSIQANFSDVVQAVYSAVSQPNSNVDANGAQIAIDVLWIASYVPGGLGDAAGLLAGMMQLGLDSSNNADGSPTVTNFQTAAGQLADDLANDYQTVNDQLAAVGDVLVSDWGRLSAAGQNADGDWSWDPATDQPGAIDTLVTAMKKLSFETLFSAVYTTYHFGDQEPTDATQYVCNEYVPPELYINPYNPFANEPEGGNTVVVGAGPQTDLWAFGRLDEQFLLDNSSQRATNGVPPQGLYDDMFVNPSRPNVPVPPLPSPLRFDLDAYVDRPLITHNQAGVCLVDGVVPAPSG